MPKAKTSELRPPAVVALLAHAFLLVLALPPVPAWAQDGLPAPPGVQGGPSASTTLEQAVQAARQKKAREAEAALQERLGLLPLPVLPTVAPTPGVERPLELPPRLWSLASLGDHTWAEVYLNGQIHALDSARLPATLGVWTVRSLTPEALVLSRAPERKGKATRGAPVPLVLTPPAPGSTAQSVLQGAVAERPEPATTGTAASAPALPDSARRAAQLPLPQPLPATRPGP